MICSYDLQLHGGSSLGIATISSSMGIKRSFLRNREHGRRSNRYTRREKTNFRQPEDGNEARRWEAREMDVAAGHEGRSKRGWVRRLEREATAGEITGEIVETARFGVDRKVGEEEEKPRETIDCRALKPQFSTS